MFRRISKFLLPLGMHDIWDQIETCNAHNKGQDYKIMPACNPRERLKIIHSIDANNEIDVFFTPSINDYADWCGLNCFLFGYPHTYMGKEILGDSIEKLLGRAQQMFYIFLPFTLV